MLIGMDFIVEILETAIHTAFVKDAIPSSVILVGPSGAGKSQALLLFNEAQIPNIHHSDDLTSRGIEDVVLSDPENKTSHLLCPDFNVVLSHRESVVNLTSAKLMTLMSDGSIRIDDGRTQKEVNHRPVGILSAMTNRIYTKVSKKWDMLGFKRRFIPIFFDYSTSTRTEIQTSIRKGFTGSVVLKRNPLAKNIKVTAIKLNSKEAILIESLSSALADNLSYHPRREAKTGIVKAAPGEKFLEFTPHHVLRTMARGHALLKHRKVVNKADIEFLAKMIDFCKYGHPVMI